MVLQVHHGGPVLLLEGPKLVLPFPAPLPSLVQLGGTRTAVLNIKCLNFEVDPVNDGLVVQVVRAGRGPSSLCQ